MEENILTPLETKSIFDGMEIRRIWQNGERFFAIIDVVSVLTSSTQPSRYRTELKNTTKDQLGIDVFDKIEKLKLAGTYSSQTNRKKMKQVIYANPTRRNRVITSSSKG